MNVLQLMPFLLCGARIADMLRITTMMDQYIVAYRTNRWDGTMMIRIGSVLTVNEKEGEQDAGMD